MGSIYIGYWLAQRLVAMLPNRSSLRIADRLADCQWRRSASDRQAVQRNLSLALGRPVAGDAPLVREVFRSFARSVVEFFAMHRLSLSHVRLEGSDHLTGAQAAPGGIIALTAHLGNWELAAALMNHLGWSVAAIALPHEDPRTNHLFTRQRARCGVATIPLGEEAARRGLAHLRGGRLLGILGDREFAGHGTPVEFFGRPVRFPRGPALLSLRSRAPIVPLFLIREGPWRFRLCVEPPLSLPSPRASLENSVQQLTQTFADILARYVRRFPDQWLMFRPISSEEGRMPIDQPALHSSLITHHSSLP